ncbi:unnamed protein product [Linum trigynum]|uniref:DRBM domain-containing protein n=1 Tax=Linum trigynum TaxID=586398 RepID=A0AAV2D455_9ROSI
MSDGQHAGRPQAPSSQQASFGKRARTEDGVSSCYIFKSRLQEYAQKAGLPTPVYETTKEGLSHEPFFRSTVIVNEVRYDSLLGFMNRKAAEQSAAEVALLELAKSGHVNGRISQPVHETGLCKNLLQEYAQKMSYAIPLYQHEKHETRNHGSCYQCSVMIGGTKYIGAVATSKKEAEIKAARTAWFAIKESSTELSGRSTENPMLTVIPSRKRVLEAPSVPNETTNTAHRAKKARFNKKRQGKKPKSQVPETGTTEPISNASQSADGQPGAQVQHMVVSGQAWCQYPSGMEGAVGESINNSNPTLYNPPSVPKKTTIPNPKAMKARFNKKTPKKKRRGKKKPKSQIPESGITEPISNACHFAYGQPGAQFHQMAFSGQAWCQYPRVMEGPLGESINNSYPTLDNPPMLQQMGGHGVNIHEGGISGNSSHTGWLTLCCGNSGENSKGNASVATGAPESSTPSAVGSSTPAIVGDKGCQTANVNHTFGQDSTGVIENSIGDTTMANGEVAEDGKLSVVETQAADVGGHGADIHHTNGEDFTDILQESKNDTSTTVASGVTEDAKLSAVTTQAAGVGHEANIHHTEDSTYILQESNTTMASGITEDAKLSAVETQAADVGGNVANIHHSNGEDSTEILRDSKEDTAMACGATEDGVSSTTGTHAPDVCGHEGSSRGTNIHHTSGSDSTVMIEDSKGDTSMANGATEDGTPSPATEDIVLSAAETQAPAGGREGSHGTNIHHTNGPDSTGMVEASVGDTSMASAAPEDDMPSTVTTSTPDVVHE